MSLEQSLKGSRFLVIDDFANVRKSIKSMLGQLGAGNVYEAGNAIQAKKIAQDVDCDFIICDYNLGSGLNGQQLLEELRQTQKIKHTTSFVMITAETSRDMVMGALEHIPDDYLSKPFAFDELKRRLERWVVRRNALWNVHVALDEKDEALALKELDRLMKENPRFRGWAVRRKIDLLLELGELEKAQEHVNIVLKQRPQNWALLAEAKILLLKTMYAEAEEKLTTLTTMHHGMVEAWDLLAECHLNKEAPDEQAAFEALQRAVKISPRNTERQQKLVKLSRRFEDYKTAVKSLREIIQVSANTSSEKADHYVELARSMADLAANGGDSRRLYRSALDVIKKMNQRFDDKASHLKGLQVNTELFHAQDLKAAKDDAAHKLLKSAIRNNDVIEDDLMISLASTLYSCDLDVLGDQWVQHLKQAQPDNPQLLGQLQSLQAEPKNEADKQRAYHFNVVGNDAYRKGDFDLALRQFEAALQIAPKRPGLLLNKAQTHLKLIKQNPSLHIEACDTALSQLDYLPQTHPQFKRYFALAEKLLRIKERFNETTS